MRPLPPRIPFALALAFFVSGSQLAPPAMGTAGASPCATAKKKNKKPLKRSAAERSPASPSKRVTAQVILQWKKNGASDEEIAERAKDGGYRLTSRDRVKLKKARLSKSLIASLDGHPQNAGASLGKPRSEPIDITKLTNPNDIDFDSVPPPAGVPKQYATPPVAQVQKKQLDRSARPSAPFEEEEEETKSDRKDRRTDKSTAIAKASTSKNRVVYSANRASGE